MLNFLGPKLIEKYSSKYSGDLLVMQGFGGHKYIATGALTQSGGIIKELWDPILKKIAEKNKTWLILGLAAGTLATEISHRFSPLKIVGVEIDPTMVEIGKKYFALDSVTNLEIVISDANKYVNSLRTEFDYIFVDMYLSDLLPDFVYTNKFISQLAKNGKKVIFNHLFYDSQKKSGAEKLIEVLEKNFTHIQPVRNLTNLLLICSN